MLQLPLSDLILLRHGEAEGNKASKRSRKGDHSLFTPEFKKKDSSQWRLTDEGITQAIVAGIWLKQINFDAHITSSYLRASETASQLNLPKANWQEDPLVRERDWGGLETMNYEELHIVKHLRSSRLDADSFYWDPPIGTRVGESMEEVCLRVGRFIEKFQGEEWSNKKLIVVTHGDVIWAFRILLEGIPSLEFIRCYNKAKRCNWITNGQLFHYSNRNARSSDAKNRLGWVQSICPWESELPIIPWTKIV